MAASVKSFMQIVSVDLVSKSSSLLPSSSFLLKTIFLTPFFISISSKNGELVIFYDKLGMWKSFINLNFIIIHKISVIFLQVFCVIFLCFRLLRILFLKDFMFRFSIVGFFSYVFLVLMSISMS